MPENLRISADELRAQTHTGEEFTLVDIRNPNAWAEANDRAAGAIHVSRDVDQVLPRIPRGKPIVAYCT